MSAVVAVSGAGGLRKEGIRGAEGVVEAALDTAAVGAGLASTTAGVGCGLRRAMGVLLGLCERVQLRPGPSNAKSPFLKLRCGACSESGGDLILVGRYVVGWPSSLELLPLPSLAALRCVALYVFGCEMPKVESNVSVRHTRISLGGPPQFDPTIVPFMSLTPTQYRSIVTSRADERR
ncbi:hypothetical protein KCV07_g4, partial [Aureobasidium melanogenum]